MPVLITIMLNGRKFKAALFVLQGSNAYACSSFKRIYDFLVQYDFSLLNILELLIIGSISLVLRKKSLREVSLLQA